MFEAIALWLGIWGGLSGVLSLIANHGIRANELVELADRSAEHLFYLSQSAERKFFGNKYFSVRSFILSCGISITIVCCIIGYYIYRFYQNINTIELRNSWEEINLTWSDLVPAIIFLCILILTVVIPDFASNQFTRYLIRNTKTKLQGIRNLFLDSVGSLFLSSSGGIVLMIWAILQPRDEGITHPLYQTGAFVDAYLDILLVFYIPSGIVTTIWLWVFLVGWFARDFVAKFGAGLRLNTQLQYSALGCAATAVAGVPIIIVYAIVQRILI